MSIEVEKRSGQAAKLLVRSQPDFGHGKFDCEVVLVMRGPSGPPSRFPSQLLRNPKSSRLWELERTGDDLGALEVLVGVKVARREGEPQPDQD